MEHFSAIDQEKLSYYLHSCTHHAVFHSILSDKSEQDSDTTDSHIKQIIDIFKISRCLGSGHSNIWDNTEGCAENYRCSTALYLLSILSQSFNIIIDHGISVPGHKREVVDNLNATYKR